jgi:hypothetical protein
MKACKSVRRLGYGYPDEVSALAALSLSTLRHWRFMMPPPTHMQRFACQGEKIEA